MLPYKSSRKFQNKVSNFPTEVYRITDPSTHLFKLMYAILEVGIGQLQRWQDEANNSESMSGTKYTDLDALFAFLGITRLTEEIYPYDPFHAQLTAAQWNEILAKDALFRLRIVKFFQAMLRGGTPEGIQMMAEAASGVECQVFEMWRVLNGRGLAQGLDLGRRDDDGNLLLELSKEFVIIPLEQIHQGQRAAIIHLVDLIKPVNTVSTVHTSPTIPLEELVVRFSASESHYFEVRRMVTASNDPLFESKKIWIEPNREVEAPTFAMMDHHDTEFSLNEAVTSIKTFRADEDFLVSFATVVSVAADISDFNANTKRDQPEFISQTLPINGGTLDQKNRPFPIDEPYALPGITDLDTTLVVDESFEPAAPSFPIRIDDEEIFVTDRTPVIGEDTQFSYTVLRAQNGTTAVSHTNAALVYSGITAIFAEDLPTGSGFGPWRAVPLADSPDNYPTGQYPGDPGKYDAESNYLFDYDSQAEYLTWYSSQVQSLGGEVLGAQYRLPLAVETAGGLASSPEDALAPPEFLIQTRIYPE